VLCCLSVVHAQLPAAAAAAAPGHADALGALECDPLERPEADAVGEVTLLQLAHQVTGSASAGATPLPEPPPGNAAAEAPPPRSAATDAPWEDTARQARPANATRRNLVQAQPRSHRRRPWSRSSPPELSEADGRRAALLELSASQLGATAIVFTSLGVIFGVIFLYILISSLIPTESGSAEEREDLRLRPRWPAATHRTPRPLPEAGAAGSLLQEPPSPLVVKEIPPAMPPPLCEKLILPNTQVRYAIPLDQITNVAASGITRMDITSPSGRPLLHVSLSIAWGGGKTLAISSVGCEDDPRALVANSPTSTTSFRILGRGGFLYGELVVAPSGGNVIYNGQQVMMLQHGSTQHLEMKAYSMGGQQLATAGLEDVSGRKEWRLQACPGCDAVLVTSCMLAMLIGL